MKELFQSYIPDNELEVERVWQDALIVFDANTLLNLYRYSDSSRSEFIALLKSLRERIWTPEQAAHEYFQNRSRVIGEQSKAYEVAAKTIKDLRDALRKDRGHPFIQDKTMDDLLAVLTSVEDELDTNKELQISRIPQDEIMLEIAEIFDGRVGERLSIEELETIFEEGSGRYEQKVPPGYRDATKHDNPTSLLEKRSVYGDLILWKQTIDKAKELLKPVIFVTDDAKDDWWLEAQGKTIGPRIELLEEFRQQVGQKFYMYRPDQFLKYAKEQLHSTISRETIDEIKATEDSRVSLGFESSGLNKRVSHYFVDRDDILGRQKSDFDSVSESERRGNFRLIKYQRGHSIDDDSTWSTLEALKSKQQAVSKNLDRMSGELRLLSRLLSELRAEEDFDLKKFDYFRDRKEALEKRLFVEQRRLEELGKEIELELVLNPNLSRDEESL